MINMNWRRSSDLRQKLTDKQTMMMTTDGQISSTFSSADLSGANTLVVTGMWKFQSFIPWHNIIMFAFSPPYYVTCFYFNVLMLCSYFIFDLLLSCYLTLTFTRIPDNEWITFSDVLFLSRFCCSSYMFSLLSLFSNWHMHLYQT